MVRSYTPEFEVTWTDPEDANHVWAIDRNHFAHPMPALGQELIGALAVKSWERKVAFVNGYLYLKDYGPPPAPRSSQVSPGEARVKRAWRTVSSGRSGSPRKLSATGP